METHPGPGRGTKIALTVLGALIGLFVAMVAVLNLHILVGLEEGYASTPAQVAEFSPVLLVVDVLLTVGLPVFGALAVTRLFRRGRAADRG